ncbi:hypothetical protein AHAS_Ahas08G0049100 [Arachis hypogaea]
MEASERRGADFRHHHRTQSPPVELAVPGGESVSGPCCQGHQGYCFSSNSASFPLGVSAVNSTPNITILLSPYDLFLPSIQFLIAVNFMKIKNILIPGIAEPHGSWQNCRDDISNCTPDQLDAVQGVDWDEDWDKLEDKATVQIEGEVMMIDIGNKKERKKVREVKILKKDPEQLKKQIENLEMMSVKENNPSDV